MSTIQSAKFSDNIEVIESYMTSDICLEEEYNDWTVLGLWTHNNGIRICMARQNDSRWVLVPWSKVVYAVETNY